MTDAVRKHVHLSRITLKVNNDLVPDDPAPNVVKILAVTYELAGRRASTVVHEGDVLSLPRHDKASGLPLYDGDDHCGHSEGEGGNGQPHRPYRSTTSRVAGIP